MPHPASRGATRLHQLSGVVARVTAYDHEHVGLRDELMKRLLPIVWWLADRSDETDFGPRPRGADRQYQLADPIDGLRRLRNDSEMGAMWKSSDVGRATNHHSARKIFGQAPHFHMTGLADHNRKVAGRHQLSQ